MFTRVDGEKLGVVIKRGSTPCIGIVTGQAVSRIARPGVFTFIVIDVARKTIILVGTSKRRA
jgi:hypothetical protein